MAFVIGQYTSHCLGASPNIFAHFAGKWQLLLDSTNALFIFPNHLFFVFPNHRNGTLIVTCCMFGITWSRPSPCRLIGLIMY